MVLDEQLSENCVPASSSRRTDAPQHLSLNPADLVGCDEEVPGQEMPYTLEVEDDVREQTCVSRGRPLIQE